MCDLELNSVKNLPEKDGHYLTLKLANQKELEMFEDGKLIPADDDWLVLTYENGNFVYSGMHGYESFEDPDYWAHLPKLNN